MSEIKVNSIKGVGASAAAITVDNTSGSASANLTAVNSVVMPNGGFLSNRNLVINGAMQVAQRGTSSTSSGYYSVDRFTIINTGTDESPTQAQVDVSSGTTPYTLGFRKALRVTNGNQTSGAGAGDFIWIQHVIEAQNIATSGWNYTSSSSNITLSFWIKSSVAQDFKGYLRSRDGTNYEYPFATGALTADTWTKITKTIPGNSNIQIDNDNEAGFEINLFPFLGTDRTDGSVTENAWATFNSAARTKDNTSTWYTTNNATLEVTGYQLEVGSVATDFEHRSLAQELALCRRYYFGDTGSGLFGVGRTNNASTMFSIQFPTEMRSNPSMSLTTTTVTIAEPGQANFNITSATIAEAHSGTKTKAFYLNGTMSVSNGDNLFLTTNYLKFDAEL